VTLLGLFINSPDMVVKLSDGIFSLTVQATYINNGEIDVVVPAVYDYNLKFPLILTMSVSFDAGQYYYPAPTQFVYPTAAPLIVDPDYLPVNIKSNLYLNATWPTQFYLGPGETFSMRLVDVANSSNIISLTCAGPTCTMINAPNRVAQFQLEVYVVRSGVNVRLFFDTNIVQSYIFPDIRSIASTPRILIRKTTRMLSLTQTGLMPYKKMWVRLRDTGPILAASDLVLGGVISSTGVTANIPTTMTAQSTFISLSPNGYYYHDTVLTLPVLEDYSLSAIVNLANDRLPDHIFSFQRTPVRIDGPGLIQTTNYQMIIQNPGFIVNITRPYTFTNGSYFLTLPLAVELNIPFNVTFPLKVQFGLSYNFGYDWKYVDFYYVDTFPSATYASLFPTIIGRVASKLTLFGLNMDLAALCPFYTKENQTGIGFPVASPVIIPDQLIQAGCPIPAITDLTITSITVFVTNSQSEQSDNGLNVYIYETPTINSYTPNIGDAFANFDVTIMGANFTKNDQIPNIYCVVGQKECTRSCVYISDTQVRCHIDSNPSGSYLMRVTYNKVNYYDVGMIQFTECEAGYSSPDFTIRCTLCPPGTYKPTKGFYKCLPCANETFNQFFGSLSCDKCGDNTTTLDVGASTTQQCVCAPGYYYNTNPSDLTGNYRKCIACPIGGFCNSTNTTIPTALEGYWYDNSDWSTFQSCTPTYSCPGGGFANCTQGYSGPRCGYCSRNYFRNRKNCLACDPPGTVWTRIVAIAVCVFALTIAFFLLSSAKVSHISSIAIALSLWQVLAIMSRFDIQWPLQMDSALSAASVVNFNTDFLSPNCIFPALDYTSIWFLKMSIPFIFLASFILLYVFLFLRSTFALTCLKIPYIKDDVASDSDDEEADDFNVKKKSPIKKIWGTISGNLLSGLLWLRNFTVWYFTERSTLRDFRKIYNKMYNAYLSFVSFAFMFIITTSAEIFVCDYQTNGTYTMQNSPDILCYSSRWWIMSPFSILYFIIFGGGSALYFAIILIKFKDWRGDRDFKERNKFMLSRFKKRFFFWEAVVTVRKTIISLISIFGKPMFVITFAVFISFIGFLLHIHFIPFHKKFHNIIEYFVLLITMLVLFFGLLFFVDKFPSPGWKAASSWVSFLIIIVGTILVVTLILVDIFIRKRKDRQRAKIRIREKIEEEKKNERFEDILKQLHPTIQNPNVMPWDVAHNYKPIQFVSSDESAEDTTKDINELFEYMFSTKRLGALGKSFKKKAVKVIASVQDAGKGKKGKKLTKEEKMRKKMEEEAVSGKSHNRTKSTNVTSKSASNVTVRKMGSVAAKRKTVITTNNPGDNLPITQVDAPTVTHEQQIEQQDRTNEKHAKLATFNRNALKDVAPNTEKVDTEIVQPRNETIAPISQVQPIVIQQEIHTLPQIIQPTLEEPIEMKQPVLVPTEIHQGKVEEVEEITPVVPIEVQPLPVVTKKTPPKNSDKKKEVTKSKPDPKPDKKNAGPKTVLFTKKTPNPVETPLIPKESVKEPEPKVVEVVENEETTDVPVTHKEE
jgi:hypothetical protein